MPRQEHLEGGYVKLPRQLVFGELEKLRPSERWLAIVCLAAANHKSRRFFDRKTKKFINIPRGAFLTSLEKLAAKSGLTVRTVRTGLEILGLTGFLTNAVTNAGRIISITNFDAYQNQDAETDKQVDKQVDSSCTSHFAGKNYQQTRIKQEELTNFVLKDKVGDLASLDHPSDVVSSKQRRRVSKKRDAPDPRVKQFIDFWCQEYQEIFEVPYLVSWGKDGTLIKRALACFDLDELKSLASDFFFSGDDWQEKHGFTIATFVQGLNQLARQRQAEKQGGES